MEIFTKMGGGPVVKRTLSEEEKKMEWWKKPLCQCRCGCRAHVHQPNSKYCRPCDEGDCGAN